ncbi:MAG TPA: 4-hydroxy-tetrahydrodipicolinate synthase [Nitrososphaerales archaeon]|nr:4-hydroxy-tetrahydrodipicolinate synthase [Nitrososphaerales archaeon]HUK74662.1 4-hydroxy-tetrahydrodipicolinate synthase [Nitrososphaerales archaeon]
MGFRFKGCYTAVVTPFDAKRKVDWEKLRALAEFQREQGVRGVVPAGTTGESPTINWEEHYRVIDSYFEAVGSSLETIAGTGSNSTEESLEATKHIASRGMKAALLVDPYYNGPSSLEVRKEYYEPIVSAFPEVEMIPYVIPGRTGTQLLPQDLAILAREYPNLQAVKEATGSAENARLTRKLCGPEFSVLSGDDDKTLSFMRDDAILCSGVISVISNVAPRAVEDLAEAALAGNIDEADRLGTALQPLFSMVTVKTDENTSFGPVPVKARNPLPIKTMMNVLGMEVGPCRAPLGRVTKRGLNHILEGLRKVWAKNPEILEPIEKAFDVSIDNRLREDKYWEGLAYGAGYE